MSDPWTPDRSTLAHVRLKVMHRCIEQLLLSNVRIFEGPSRAPLVACYALGSTLSAHCTSLRASRLDPEALIWLLEACIDELEPLEKPIGQGNGGFEKRLVPAKLCDDEVTLRCLHSAIGRYLDDLEPESALLPLQQLDQLLRQTELLTIWDMPNTEYEKGLRASIRGLKRALRAAFGSPPHWG
ncbi:hypothetical protein [Lysobacter sp. Hz 25]|uniref:hypothetical protein n=1 Tax=Lysobacter sp. Hz 25 TaxID=3383698 RepID=UPI0038D470E0